MADLRVLVGHMVTVPPEQISDGDALKIICDTAIPQLVGGGNVEDKLLELFEDLIRVSQHHNRPLAVEDVVARLLSTLRRIPVRDEDGTTLIYLGEPDYDLLPRPE